MMEPASGGGGFTVNANPDQSVLTQSTHDMTDWFFQSGRNAGGNNSNEDPHQPLSAIPIDGGGSYSNEIYAFSGTNDRFLAYKQTLSGDYTVSFKIIECGGGGGSSNPPKDILPSNGSSPGSNQMGGLGGNNDWMGNLADPPYYRPIHLAYTSTAPPPNGSPWSATWTEITTVEIHGHPDDGSLPSGAPAPNIDRDSFRSFSYAVTLPAGS